MKKVLMTFVLAAVACAGMAQNQNAVNANRQRENRQAEKTDTLYEKSWKNYEKREKGMWFFGVGAGAQYYIGDHNRQAKVKDNLGTALNVYAGRWFNSLLGARLEYTGLEIKGMTNPHGAGVDGMKMGETGNTNPSHYGPNPYGTTVEYKGRNGDLLECQAYNYFNLHMDFMFNMTQLIYGKGTVKRFDAIPYFGLGWAHVTENRKNNSWTPNLGMYTSCKITKNLDIALDIHAAIVREGFDCDEGKRKGEGIVGATLGLNCHF